MDEDAHDEADAQPAPSPATASRSLVPVPNATALPVAAPAAKQKAARRRWPRAAIALALMAAAGGGGFYVWRRSLPQLAPGLAVGNGRIEADEILLHPGDLALSLRRLADAVELRNASKKAGQ